MENNDVKFSAEGRFLEWNKIVAEKAQELLEYMEEHKEEENGD